VPIASHALNLKSTNIKVRTSYSINAGLCFVVCKELAHVNSIVSNVG
jgi:hypothetical protein